MITLDAEDTPWIGIRGVGDDRGLSWILVWIRPCEKGISDFFESLPGLEEMFSWVHKKLYVNQGIHNALKTN